MDVSASMEQLDQNVLEVNELDYFEDGVHVERDQPEIAENTERTPKFINPELVASPEEKKDPSPPNKMLGGTLAHPRRASFMI